MPNMHTPRKKRGRPYALILLYGQNLNLFYHISFKSVKLIHNQIDRYSYR